MSERISRDSELTRRLHELISDHPDFEVLHAPSLHVHCFRYVPNSLTDRQDEVDVQRLLDELNQEIVAAVQRSGLGLVTTTRVRDHVAIQLSISSAERLEKDVDAIFETIARWGRLLNKKLSGSYATTPDMEASYV